MIEKEKGIKRSLMWGTCSSCGWSSSREIVSSKAESQTRNSVLQTEHAGRGCDKTPVIHSKPVS